jgi:hypothetical protein
LPDNAPVPGLVIERVAEPTDEARALIGELDAVLAADYSRMRRCRPHRSR